MMEGMMAANNISYFTPKVEKREHRMVLLFNGVILYDINSFLLSLKGTPLPVLVSFLFLVLY